MNYELTAQDSRDQLGCASGAQANPGEECFNLHGNPWLADRLRRSNQRFTNLSLDNSCGLRCSCYSDPGAAKPDGLNSHTTGIKRRCVCLCLCSSNLPITIPSNLIQYAVANPVRGPLDRKRPEERLQSSNQCIKNKNKETSTKRRRKKKKQMPKHIGRMRTHAGNP